MSQELFGEAPKRRNKKNEEKRKLNRKNGRELPDNKLYTIILFLQQMETTLEMGLGDIPPPFHLDRKFSSNLVADSILMCVL